MPSPSPRKAEIQAFSSSETLGNASQGNLNYTPQETLKAWQKSWKMPLNEQKTGRGSGFLSKWSLFTFHGDILDVPPTQDSSGK